MGRKNCTFSAIFFQTLSTVCTTCNLMTVYRFPPGPSTPPHVFRQNPEASRRRAFIGTKAFRDCVYWFGMVSFHQDRSCHVDVQKLSANPRCGPCPIVKFCVYILQGYWSRKDHLSCSHLLCHCVFSCILESHCVGAVLMMSLTWTP